MASIGVALILFWTTSVVSTDHPMQTTPLPSELTPPSVITETPPNPADASNEQPDVEGFLGNCGYQRIIKTAHGTLLRSTWPEGKVDHTEGPATVSAYWSIEIRGQKVVLMPSSSPGRALQAHTNGTIELADSTSESVEFTPFANDDGSYSLQSEDERWLSVNKDGAVTTSEQEDEYRPYWHKFWLRSLKDCYETNSDVNQAKIVEGHWSIVSAQHTYLYTYISAMFVKRGSYVIYDDGIQPWDTPFSHWLIEARGDKVVLRDIFGLFLRPHNTRYVDTTPEVHMWKPHKNEDGTWSFESEEGTWLSAGINNTAVTSKHRFSMEKFWFEEW